MRALRWPYLSIAVVGFKRFSSKVEHSCESLGLSNKYLQLAEAQLNSWLLALCNFYLWH